MRGWSTKLSANNGWLCYQPAFIQTQIANNELLDFHSPKLEHRQCVSTINCTVINIIGPHELLQLTEVKPGRQLQLHSPSSPSNFQSKQHKPNFVLKTILISKL